MASDLLRGEIIRRNVCIAVAYYDWWGGTFRSTDPVELDRTLLQDNHLLRRHIVCCLQGVEIGAAGHLLSRLRPTTPVDGLISPQVSTSFLKS